jgi:hypothetical protein
MNEKKESLWSSIPSAIKILTALIIAITGLIVALTSTGIFRTESKMAPVIKQDTSKPMQPWQEIHDNHGQVISSSGNGNTNIGVLSVTSKQEDHRDSLFLKQRNDSIETKMKLQKRKLDTK